MRRKILFAVLIILAFMAAAVQSALAGDEAYTFVRVKISIGKPVEYTFYVDGNYDVAGSGLGLERQLYTVRLEGGGLGLYIGAERLCGGATIKLVQHTGTDGRNNFIWMERADRNRRYRYPGDMEFLVDAENACIMAVNHVYMEDYACGVVPYEMYESWPRDALKAGAIAARTYAEHRMGSTGLYDVIDTTGNQVYYGYDPGNTNSIAAVSETANTVLKCGGKLVDVYYSASNGGFTEIPQHVWSSTNPLQPYHIIQADPFDVQNAHSAVEVLVFPKTITDTDRITYLDGGSPGSGNESAVAENYIKNCALPAVAANGYIANVPGDIQITGIVGIAPNTLIGNHYIKDYNGNDACPRYRYAVVTMNILATRYATPDELQQTGQPTVTGQLTIAIYIDLTEFSNSKGAYRVFHEGLRLTTVEETDTSWRIYHRGNGHGIGLSQRGTEQQALSGRSYLDILGFYFPNTTLEQQSYTRPPLTPITPPDHTNATVKGDANVRTGPGKSYGEIGTLPLGARLFVVQAEASPGWHIILYGGSYAFMSASLIQMDSAPPPAEQVVVWFEASGGSPVSPWGGYYAGCIPEAPATLRDNYTFAGWFYDAGLKNQAVFPCAVTHNTALYAKWIENNCTVTFDSQGGSPVAPVTVANGYAIGAPASPALYGYDFAGWYTASGAVVQFPYTVTASQTLYAAWSPQPQTCYLKGIGYSAGRLNRAFSKTVYSYKLYLGENEGSVTLTPVKEFDGANVTINKKAGPYTLSVANGRSVTVSIKVTFGGASKTYKVTVTRAKSTNNYLGALSVTAGTLSQPFDPNVTSYTLALPEGVKSTTIKAAAAAGKLASVSPSSSKVSLNNGQSKTVKITVKAQSGAKRTYTVRVVRAASTNADLKSLKVSGLTPRFSPGNTNYSVTLPASKNSITISAGAVGYKAVVYFDGQKKSSKKVSLVNGQSVAVRVTVVSQAGNTKEYIITVTRQ